MMPPPMGTRPATTPEQIAALNRLQNPQQNFNVPPPAQPQEQYQQPTYSYDMKPQAGSTYYGGPSDAPSQRPMGNGNAVTGNNWGAPPPQAPRAPQQGNAQRPAQGMNPSSDLPSAADQSAADAFARSQRMPPQNAPPQRGNPNAVRTFKMDQGGNPYRGNRRPMNTQRPTTPVRRGF